MAKPLDTPPGILLAGGRSSRMGGRDKALVSLAGRPMVDHMAEILSAQVSRMAINSNASSEPFPPEYPVLSDTFGDYPGPLAGILVGLDWAKRLRSEWLVTAPIDVPFLPANFVAKLIEAQAVSGAPIVLAETSDGVHPVAGLWFTGLADSLRGSIEEGLRRVTDFTEEKDSVTALFADEAFFNVNTPEDIEIAEARLLHG